MIEFPAKNLSISVKGIHIFGLIITTKKWIKSSFEFDSDFIYLRKSKEV